MATVEILVPPNHPEGASFAFQLDMFEEYEGYFARQVPNWPILTGEFATPTRQECATYFLPLVQRGVAFTQ